MKVSEHRGRTYTARSEVVSTGVYRGVFDVDSTGDDVTNGVINEATAAAFSTPEQAEAAAVIAATTWIDKATDAV